MKLVIEEPESHALESHLGDDVVMATSRVALVEVSRATRLANPDHAVQDATRRVLGGCMLVDVGERVLRSATRLAGREVRSLAAIHLATALHIDADELVAYERRLLDAAETRALRVASPGLQWRAAEPGR